jgi:hypothetical protein
MTSPCEAADNCYRNPQPQEGLPLLLSKEARLVSGITVLVIPTIMYGGWVLLGILTHGSAVPMPGDLKLNDNQWALWRAGHAHAGVWTILSLLLQALLDSTRLSSHFRWLARVAAPLSAVALSAGFFGLAFSVSFRWLIYLGVLTMLAALVITGIGLLRR